MERRGVERPRKSCGPCFGGFADVALGHCLGTEVACEPQELIVSQGEQVHTHLVSLSHPLEKHPAVLSDRIYSEKSDVSLGTKV